MLHARRWGLKALLDADQSRKLAPPYVQPFFLSSEDVLIHAIALPNLPPAQRRAAAAFAVEDLIAQPLDQVRVILGPQYQETAGKWLVAVVDNAVLARAVEQAGAFRPVLAEVMRLPIPQVGWSVALRDGRLLVRRDDGSGFGVEPALASTIWTMDGAPPLTGYGDDLPSDLPLTIHKQWPETMGMPPYGFDLAAVSGRRRSYAQKPRWIWGLGFVSLALATHLSLLALDVYALQRLSADSRRALTEVVAPYARSGEDPVAAASRVLAARNSVAAPAFLTLATQVIAALPQPETGVSLRSLRFDEDSGSMVLAVIAPDIATLQAVEAAMTAAGLAVVLGPAASRNGAAEAEMTVTKGQAP